MRLKRVKKVVGLLFALLICSMYIFLPATLNVARAEDFSPPSDGAYFDSGPSGVDPGTSWVPPDGGMPSGMMGSEMMGPGMSGGGMPPPEGSGWSNDANGNWTPPTDWTPPVGWTPPTGWQPGQAISGELAPWNQVGMTGEGGMPMMGMPSDLVGPEGLFGPGGPAIGDLLGVSGVDGTGSGSPGDCIPLGMSMGIFGGDTGFFNGGVMGMTGTNQTGPLSSGIPPSVDSGWSQGDDGTWIPPSDWVPPIGWIPPADWQAGQQISDNDAPWNQLPVGSAFIPGTLIRMSSDMTLDQVLANFDPNAHGLTLPSFLTPEDFQKIMKGEATVDNMTQEMLKALNPGKFGPMSDPYIMARSSGLTMDEMGNFFVQASEGAPGNPFIVRAKTLADEGKFGEALEALNDPAAPFNQFPDALIRTWKASLAAQSGGSVVAVQNIEKALALAPFDNQLYQKAGEIYRQAGINGPQVFVNGVKPDFDVQPFVESGRTLVPFRALAETMGASVSWDDTTRTVTVLKGENEIKMVIGSSTATVNGNPHILDVQPKVVNGRTVIPLRFVGESLNATVGYDSATEIVKILPKVTTAVY